MKKLFGTDGIRSEAGAFPLDEATIPAIGQAIGERLGGTILIGRDPRVSSPWILALLREGLERAGAGVEDAGVLPTPAVALLTQRQDATGGVMISASHNRFSDNGIKAFGPDGRKLEEAAETAIEERVIEILRTGTGSVDSPHGPGNTRELPTSDRYVSLYAALLVERFPDHDWLSGLRIALDCANGAMSGIAGPILGSLGARTSAIHAEPSGRNINQGCGAVHPESLARYVRHKDFDLGVAFDGDGDRSIFVTGSGDLADGDAALYVLARHMRKKGELKPAVVVGTSMTNFGLERALADDGIALKRVDVGDRHIFHEMLSSGALLGGEPSGHIIFPDYGLSGDGLFTTLKLCDVIQTEGKPLDQLIKGWQAAPQLIRNIKVSEKIPLESVPAVTDAIQAIARRLEGRGRIVVRYSGTEPLLRIMVESDSEPTNEACADELAEIVDRTLTPTRENKP